MGSNRSRYASTDPPTVRPTTAVAAMLINHRERDDNGARPPAGTRALGSNWRILVIRSAVASWPCFAQSWLASELGRPQEVLGCGDVIH